MATQKRYRIRQIAAAATLFAIPIVGLSGGRQIVTLAVSAQVSPSASFKVPNTPDVVVTSDEASQGYVDIPVASLLTMNVGKLRPELIVEFSPSATGFASLLVRTEGRQSQTRDAMLKQPPEKSSELDTRALVEQATSVVLSYRASIGEATKSGQYAEPLVIAINL